MVCAKDSAKTKPVGSYADAIRTSYAGRLLDTIAEAEKAVDEALRDAKSKIFVFDCEGVNLSSTGELTLVNSANARSDVRGRSF